jgi:alpha-glucosidase
MPIVRPLFLDFPNATPDGHPLDLDAGGEFLFGPDLLVAPSPYPDELDPYELKLPPGDWYDYWTGKLTARVTSTSTRDAEQPLATTPPDSQRTQSAKEMTAPAASETHPLMITPSLETLPVYVRGGAILPVQPLVQSTEEKPEGPLTLRVYVPGDAGTGTPDCHGSVYLDDGISFAFRTGQFLRMDSTCALVGNELHIRVGAHQGSFRPWWQSLRIEVYGWRTAAPIATADNQPVQQASGAGDALAFTLPDPGTGVELVLK